MSKAAQEIFRAISNAPFVWTTGVGKSACVADLLARYLRNVGVPAAFMDASDYWHGGRGGVGPGHLFVAVCYSGQTKDMVKLVDDCCCEVLHIGVSPMTGADMFWRAGEGLGSRAVSIGPVQSARAVYDLVCEYAQYAGVSRHEAEVNHPENNHVPV